MRLVNILILMLTVYNTYGQKNIEVYRYGILGQMYNEQGKEDSAEKYLEKALYRMKDKTSFGPFFSLIKFAYKKQDEKKIAEYFSELSCIYTKDTIYTYLNEYAEINMDTTTYNKLYKPKCVLAKNKTSAAHPMAVDSTIAYIIKRDQEVRKKAHKREGEFTAQEKADISKKMREADSINFEILYSCIKRYGFPEIDPPLSWSRVTLLMHIDNYSNFKKIDKQLVSAMKKGQLSPATYAYALDRSLIGSKLKPKYYWLVKGSFDEYKPENDEIPTVNKEREKIGLPSYPMWTGWGF